jgi:hypothetical protein
MILDSDRTEYVSTVWSSVGGWILTWIYIPSSSTVRQSSSQLFPYLSPTGPQADYTFRRSLCVHHSWSNLESHWKVTGYPCMLFGIPTSLCEHQCVNYIWDNELTSVEDSSVSVLHHCSPWLSLVKLPCGPSLPCCLSEVPSRIAGGRCCAGSFASCHFLFWCSAFFAWQSAQVLKFLWVGSSGGRTLQHEECEHILGTVWIGRGASML